MSSQTLKKKDFRKKICDSSETIESLNDSININDYLGVDIPDEKTIMYGVNVQVKGDAKILPFIFCTKEDFKPMDVVKAVSRDNFKVPNFLRDFEIKEILFSCDICLSDSLSIANMSVKGCKNIDGEEMEEAIKKLNLGKIVEWLNNTYSFLIQNLIALKIKDKTKCYVWISGEDYDPESGGANTMSNILAISDDEAVIRRIREKRTDIVDFLFLLKSIYLIEIAKKNKWEALKSAVSAIMSRNMSHNLGSHYLYYTKKHLERLANELSIEQSPDIRGAAMVLGYTQERMDYLATIISNDKYPYGSVNFKSQIFDALTVDDFSKRHFSKKDDKIKRTLNYLLSNLIRSEGFSRPGIIDEKSNGLDLLKLQIKYSEDGAHYKCFTGTNFELDPWEDPEEFKDIPTVESESELKKVLSGIYIALPGGNMSCHAFFNVVENFIRNSAKYLREDFHKIAGESEQVLTTNIALKFKDEKHDYIDIIIYDDKENGTFYKLIERTKNFDKKIKNANKENEIGLFINGELNIENIREIGDSIIENINKSSIKEKKELLREARVISQAWKKDCLFEQMCKRLSSIKILDDNNALNKESKGLKEMIFSSAWMRSYKFKQRQTFTDIIFKIQQENDPNEKLKLIQEYCFSPVLVLDNDDTISILQADSDIKSVYTKPASFGISITLPIFKKTKELEIVEDEATMIQQCLKTYSDIIIPHFNGNIECPINLKEVFPRLYSNNNKEGKSDSQIFREILQKRFPNFDDYWLSFGGNQEASGIHDDAHHIKFDHHMNLHVDLETQRKYAYSDSVSGGNFTKTMNELFDNGLNEDGTYNSPEAEYLALRIKESALTRITIIDERLSDTMQQNRTQLELSLKNIRLLNYQDTDSITSFIELFKGNSFNDGKDNTHFLSIHLGLVEKIIQSSGFSNYVGDISTDDKAIRFMSLLRENFGGNDVFISVHSGRGNFSAELEGPLANCPFITMSSLENAFNNSKYLLAQLLYNTAYIGKGKINEK